MREAIKIIIIGPKKSGKTAIADFLADTSKSKLGNKQKSYQPTSGCRILELDVGPQSRPIELWDVSGDLKYEHCWPAIMQGLDSSKPSGETKDVVKSIVNQNNVDGVLLVYNPDLASQETEIGLWYDHFVTKANITKPDACMVFVHTHEPKVSFRSSPPAELKDCPYINYTTFEMGKEIREYFEEWIELL